MNPLYLTHPCPRHCVCVCSVMSVMSTSLKPHELSITHQAPLSMGFPRQEYWSGLPFPPLQDLPDPGIRPTSPALAGRVFTTEPFGKSQASGSHFMPKQGKIFLMKKKIAASWGSYESLHNCIRKYIFILMSNLFLMCSFIHSFIGARRRILQDR